MSEMINADELEVKIDKIQELEGKSPHYYNPDSLVNVYGKSDMYNCILKKDFSNCTQRKYYKASDKKKRRKK